jgi:hypothetical protein
MAYIKTQTEYITIGRYAVVLKDRHRLLAGQYKFNVTTIIYEIGYRSKKSLGKVYGYEVAKAAMFLTLLK